MNIFLWKFIKSKIEVSGHVMVSKRIRPSTLQLIHFKNEFDRDPGWYYGKVTYYYKYRWWFGRHVKKEYIFIHTNNHLFPVLYPRDYRMSYEQQIKRYVPGANLRVDNTTQLHC